MTDSETRVGYAYRPALDGIRAIAVIAVIAYHLDTDVVPGGFLGVDVFFVLSGYLIAGLLLAEHDRNGRIGLGAFWVRRARRLLPALAGVMVAVGAYGYWWAPTDTLRRLRWDGIATLFYFANWRFAFSEQSYFETTQVASPLRHAWSLAVEEQFYLLFPLIVIVCCRSRRPARTLGIASVAGAVASALVMSAFVDDADPSFVYYATHTRAQELLVGVALACLAHRRATSGRAPGRAVATQFLGFAALTAVVVVCFAVDDADDLMYRGGYLAVGVAVALLIAAAVPEGPLRTLLSVTPMRWIGQRSYGLYLWHWPVIIALDPARTDLSGWRLATMRVLVTIAAATLSYTFLEQPIRLGALPGRRFVRLCLTWLAGLLLIVVAATTGATAPSVALTGIPDDLEPQVLVADPGIDPGGPSGAGGAGRRDDITGNPDEATSGPEYQPKLIAVIGDSVATTALPGLTNEARFRGFHLVSFTVPGCGVATDIVTDQSGNLVPWSTKCDTVVTQGLTNLVETWNADLFVWWSGWETADRLVDDEWLRNGTPAWQADLDRQLEARLATITARGAKVILVDSAPKAASPVGEADPDPNGRHDALRQRMLAVAARHPDTVAVARFSEVLCPDGAPCPREIDGVVPRPNDGGHFTDDTAAWAGAQLWPLLESAWKEFPVASSNATDRNA